MQVQVSAAAAPETAAPQVLIMEDDVDFAFWMKDVLIDKGFEVVWARNGTEALEKLDSAQFDLLITDIFVHQGGRLTSNGGISLIGSYRNRARGMARATDAPMPIIAITGAKWLPGQQHILDTAKTIGANFALHKPFGREELLETVAEALDERGY